MMQLNNSSLEALKESNDLLKTVYIQKEINKGTFTEQQLRLLMQLNTNGFSI